MQKIACLTIASIFLLIASTASRANELVTYQVQFTVTGGDVKTPPTGEFVYDMTTNQFRSFLITWDHQTIDFGEGFNLITDIAPGPSEPGYCLGSIGAQTNFLALTVPSCNGDLLTWHFARNVAVGSSYTLLFFKSGLQWYHGDDEGGKGVFGSDSDGASGTFIVYQLEKSSPSSGAAWNQIVRIIAGPVAVPPGLPVEANLGFVDVNGAAIGPAETVELTLGQTAILDLDVNTLVQSAGQRVLVRPVVTTGNPVGTAVELPAPQVPLQVVTEVFDKVTGFGTVLAPAVDVPANPVFAFQGLAGGQTMQLTVTAAGSAAPCLATLSFADRDGNAVGTSMQAALQAGEATSLNLSAAVLNLKAGQRVELQPVVSVEASSNSSCLASAEVFDNVTGRTWTYQAAGRK
jgi:hypothetical protein